MKFTELKDPTLRQLSGLDSALVAEPPIGCWLVAPRRGFTHHGIYVGGGQVVHYAGLSRGWSRGPVEIVSLSEFSLGRSLWVKWTPTARYAGLAAAQRALSRVGENSYRILTNNCEHFCTWCLDGESRSRQVERWFVWPRTAVLAMVDQILQAFSAVGALQRKKMRKFGLLVTLSLNHRAA